MLDASRADAEARADSFVELARAALPVSRAEAASCFDRAVEIASRIGDENLDRWAALLHLATTAGGDGKPRPRTTYRLSRAAELTCEYVDSHKHFDWEGTVTAMTDLCATSALAVLARWRDRRFDRGRGLLRTLVYRLFEQSRLSPTDCAALAGLDIGWDRVSDLRRILVENVPAERRASAAGIAWRYLRLEQGGRTDWPELDALIKSHGLSFPDLERLVKFNASRPKGDASPAPMPGHSPKVRRTPDWDAIFGAVDPTNTDQLARAYARMRDYDPPYEFGTFLREALARVSPGRESEVIHALTRRPDFGIFEASYLIEGVPMPLRARPAVRSSLRDAVLLACRREPGRARRGYYQLIPFDKLDADGLVANADVNRAVLHGFLHQIDSIGPGDLFNVVQPLATLLTASEADEVLTYGMDLLEGILRPEDGDGPWRPELTPDVSLSSALASYIWTGLASPVVSERWQYAHVVRAAVELNVNEFLEELARAATRDPFPFIDPSLKFYAWHARQWLLIGLARGALRTPRALQPFTPLLNEWTNEKHVLIRKLAEQAIRLAEMRAGDTLDLTRPALPQGDSDPEDEAPSEDGDHSFGLDVNAYWFSNLGSAIGLSQREVASRADRFARTRMGWDGDKRWQADARRRNGVFDDRETHHSHGTLPKTDDLLAYFGYHAMMSVAGEFLSASDTGDRVSGRLDRLESWQESYLPSRPDGTWTADRRDPVLSPVPTTPPGTGYREWPWAITATYLAEKLVTDDHLQVLWGDWTSDDQSHDETVRIRSALVATETGEALVAALQTAPELGWFDIPCVSDVEDEVATPFRLVSWVLDDHVVETACAKDPWASGVSYPGPLPESEVLARGVVRASGDGRTWRSDDGCLLRSEVWAHYKGYGRDRDAVGGSRLSVNGTFVARLLRAYPTHRLIVGVEVRRQRDRYGDDDQALSTRTQPYARYYLVGADGIAQSL